MKYFDFHCHLDTDKIAPNREEILHQMKEQDIAACTVGVDMESSQKAVALATSCSNIWACIGQHPVDNPGEEFKASAYQKLLDEHPEQVVCVGECGLDYYWLEKSHQSGEVSTEEVSQEKQRQRLLFQKQITFALVNKLPLMLHVRSSEGTEDAHEDTLEILSQYPEFSEKSDEYRVVFHFFTGSVDLAQEITTRGYYISLPGVITFAKLDEMVSSLPGDKILAETDTPYAAPVPHRGKTNNPLYVPHVYQKIAQIRGVDEEKLRCQILSNIRTFYKIDDNE